MRKHVLRCLCVFTMHTYFLVTSAKQVSPCIWYFLNWMIVLFYSSTASFLRQNPDTPTLSGYYKINGLIHEVNNVFIIIFLISLQILSCLFTNTDCYHHPIDCIRVFISPSTSCIRNFSGVNIYSCTCIFFVK